ncbi:tetratricopeptide repeat protein [bacterium]|nr:tetratricopeptide repeat protein [bacterium]
MRKRSSAGVSPAKERTSRPGSVTAEKPQSRKWLFIGAAIVLLALGALWYFWKPQEQIKTAAPATPESTVEALAKNNFQGAEKPVVEKLRNVINDVKANSSSAHSWGKLAMNLHVHDFKNEALLCYEKAAALNPSDFRWPYYRAMLLHDRGSEEALKYFEQSLNLRPNHFAGRVRYGQALLDSNRLEQAGREFVKALEINTNSSHAYVGLARISLSQNQVKDCGSLLQKAIQVNPRHGEAYGLLSEVYRRMNQHQKASAQLLISQQLPKITPLPDDLEMALIAEGVSSYWHDLRGRAALEKGDYALAEQELKKAAAASKDFSRQDTLGVAYLYQRKYAEAAAAHKKALELNPKSTASMNNLAAALYEMGQEQAAMDTIRRAIQNDPRIPYSYLHLARLNIRSGNRAAAVQAYRSGLEQLPQNQDLAQQLAWFMATSSDASLRNGLEAVRLAEAVASRNPNAETLDVLAAAYAEAGRFDRSVQVAEQALTIAESNRRQQLAERIKTHLKAFRAKRPYHE